MIIKFDEECYPSDKIKIFDEMCLKCFQELTLSAEEAGSLGSKAVRFTKGASCTLPGILTMQAAELLMFWMQNNC